MEPSPEYVNGQEVIVDLPGMKEPMKGKIVGCAMKHVLTWWLVDFGKNISEQYPYQAVSVQHTFIRSVN